MPPPPFLLSFPRGPGRVLSAPRLTTLCKLTDWAEPRSVLLFSHWGGGASFTVHHVGCALCFTGPKESLHLPKRFRNHVKGFFSYSNLFQCFFFVWKTEIKRSFYFLSLLFFVVFFWWIQTCKNTRRVHKVACFKVEFPRELARLQQTSSGTRSTFQINECIRKQRVRVIRRLSDVRVGVSSRTWTNDCRKWLNRTRTHEHKHTQFQYTLLKCSRYPATSGLQVDNDVVFF